MKAFKLSDYWWSKWIFILSVFLICSCNKWILPSELAGQWNSGTHKVTVRTMPEKHQFVFTSDSATVTLLINENKTASGTIGSAIFENVEIRKNMGNPDRTGIAYIVNCGSIGKIFENDPLDNKEVQLWLAPSEGSKMEAELRYTEGWSAFPMAGIDLMKAESKTYAGLIAEAENLYEQKEYLKSGYKYATAFIISQNELFYIGDRYNAACTWALAKEVDSAFASLFIFAEEIFSLHTIKNFPVLALLAWVDEIPSDKDLVVLHSDPRWEELIETLEKDKAITSEKLDIRLVRMLDSIYNTDQAIREPIDSINRIYGWESKEMQSYLKIMRKQDSLHLIKVEKLLNERGWLGPDIIGYEGSMALFLVIQHSAPEIRTKYLPLMREASERGDVRGDHLGYVEDRHAMENNRKQIYGSQLASDTVTGEAYVWPIIDPDHINERRTEVGLNTIEEYLLQNYGMIWDIEEHKKRIKEFEEFQNKQ